MSNKLQWVILFLLCASCAGPHSPFGAIDPLLRQSEDQHDMQEALRSIASDQIEISFGPRYQLFHRKYPLQITVYDPNGIDLNYQLRLIYNQQKVHSLKKNYTARLTDPFHMIINYPEISLDAGKNHLIEFSYYALTRNQMWKATYERPRCKLRKISQLDNFANFEVNGHIEDLILTEAHKKNINASFLAALIAQESGFNPYALSWAKAMGLTQITPLAAEHIRENNEHWPYYEKLNQMSYAKLKYLLYKKKITGGEDWRLNPLYSIQGALQFVEYLEFYWKRPDHLKLLEKRFKKDIPWTDIILASYHSGPYRLKQALRKGAHFDEMNTLTAAKLYINKVKSYCFDFEAKSKITATQLGENYETKTTSL